MPAAPAVAALDSAPRPLVLANDRAADVVAFERLVVDFFVSAADLLGVPKSVAAIYGVAFASPEPLCFADIEARLNISMGSISQGLRVLREAGALKVVDRNGGRREFFAPDMEIRELIQRWLHDRLQKQLTAGRSRLAILSRTIPDLDREQQNALRQRLKHLQAWHDKARKLLPIAKTFLALSS